MTTCNVQRRFLGWDTPFLHSAAALLLEENTTQGRCNLEDTVIVLPVSRAGRRLLELLVAKAEEQNIWLIPPQIITTGSLPELILGQNGSFATSLERRNAWASVLKELPEDQYVQVFGARKKEEIEEENVLLQIGEQIDQLHRELAGAQKTFSDVSEICKQGDFDFFDNRWDLLSEVAVAYKGKLTELSLVDRDYERIERLNGTAPCEKKICLLATADLNAITRSLIQAHLKELQAYIFAPESEAEGFDELGCLSLPYWMSKRSVLSDEQIEPCLNADTQAQAAAYFLSTIREKATPEEISLGITSDDFVPYLEQQLRSHDIPCRRAGGDPLSQTLPLKLLASIARFLQSGTMTDFAALVRHPDLLNYLERTLDTSRILLLNVLDRYQQQHLQAYATKNLPGESGLASKANALRQAVRDLIEPLTESSQPLQHWQAPILNILKSVYGHRNYQESRLEDREMIAVISSCSDLLHELTELRCGYKESYSAAEALKLLLGELGKISTKPQPAEPSVEILGWLELPLDDAPSLCIAGMNEGLVPESVNADLFLPNQLRKALGLLDNDRRFARDIYALSTMRASKRDLKLLFAKRNGRGDPLSPSRLLFLDDDDVVIDRVRRYMADGAGRRYKISSVKTETKPLIPPKPVPLDEPISSIPVTSFRDYIACPYRYYLKHVLKLQTLNDRVTEMNALSFGTLLHDVLYSFGTSEVKGSDKQDVIAEYLLLRLAQLSEKRFGHDPLPAVRVQLEQAKLRLLAFSSFQAEWRSKGWQIADVEYVIKPGEVFLDHEEGLSELTGRIDRIDKHPDGRVAVLDYKTGDMALTPERTHLVQDGWRDLQLPLYRYLLTKHGYKGDITVGYISIPRQAEDTRATLAPWIDAEYEEAVDIARDIAADIYKQKFWPPTEWVGPFDDFADILGTNQFGGEVQSE